MICHAVTAPFWWIILAVWLSITELTNAGKWYRCENISVNTTSICSIGFASARAGILGVGWGIDLIAIKLHKEESTTTML